MKRKLISLTMIFCMIAAMSVLLPMTASAYSNKTYNVSMTLEAGATYEKCTFVGSSDPANPVVITVPDEGINVSTKLGTGLTIDSGYVTFTGGKITPKDNGTPRDLIKVNGGAHLKLENITLYGPQAGGAAVDAQGELEMNGGTVLAYVSENGHKGTGINIYKNQSSPKVTMNGGKIYGFDTGVHVSYGEFTMNGGEIYDNVGKSGYSNGGGITTDHSTVVMNGGKIYNNKADDSGGVEVSGYSTFTMNGGEIYNNSPIQAASYKKGAIMVKSDSNAYLKGGMVLGEISDKKISSNSDTDPLYCGTIEGLPDSEVTIAYEDGTASVIGQGKGNTLCADKTRTVIANGRYKGEYTEVIDKNGKVTAKKWVFNVDPIFETTADAGYYAETRNAEPVSGIIAFNSFFENLEDCKDNIKAYGMYIYNQSDENAKVKLEAKTLDELSAQSGHFYTTVSNIPREDFDTYLVAMPYAVYSDSGIKTGEPYAFKVSDTEKWLGKAN